MDAETLKIVLIVVEVLLIIIGIVGAVLPVLPGTWVVYAAMLIQEFFHEGINYHWSILVGFGIITLIVQILDYLIPIWGSKKLGAGKYGQWGTLIGALAGAFFFPPFGIIIGPFLGALAGELISGKDFQLAVKAGTGAFLGFITGVVMKVGLGVVMGIWIIVKMF